MKEPANPSQILRDLTAGGSYKTLTKIKPSGSLQARRQKDGAIAFAWRYSITHPDGRERESRKSIGFYDGKLPPKSLTPTNGRYSVEAAIRACESLALKHREHRGEGGLPALEERAASEKRKEIQAAAEAANHTLRSLLEDYADHLKKLERDAHKDVRSILKHHVNSAFPELAAKPAAQVTDEDIADIMRKINEAGKLRTANKARSYIRAAYETAKSARTDATVPANFKAYNIRSNPAVETRVIKNGKRPVIRALKKEELRTYWRIIKDMPGMRGAALRLHLLTGGQRLDQLVRLTPADIKNDLITLYDGKGKPGEPPRPHMIPLVALAAKALRNCVSTEGAWALTSDGGKTHIAGETLSGWAIDAVGDKISGFQPKQIRSGIETLLAEAGVPKETRGRLQSHGISGVQDRHYNAHEYMGEKRAALEYLVKLIQEPTGAGGKVVRLPARRRA